jgi:hypothetical protein
MVPRTFCLHRDTHLLCLSAWGHTSSLSAWGHTSSMSAWGHTSVCVGTHIFSGGCHNPPKNASVPDCTSSKLPTCFRVLGHSRLPKFEWCHAPFVCMGTHIFSVCMGTHIFSVCVGTHIFSGGVPQSPERCECPRLHILDSTHAKIVVILDRLRGCMELAKLFHRHHANASRARGQSITRCHPPSYRKVPPTVALAPSYHKVPPTVALECDAD